MPFFWSQHYDMPINYVGHAENWDELAVEGDIAGKDCLVRYKLERPHARRRLDLPRRREPAGRGGDGTGDDGALGFLLNKSGGTRMAADNDSQRQTPPAQPRMVRRAGRSDDGGALSRALHEFRPDAGRAAQQPADHRHRPDRQRPVALQPPPSRPRRAACATASATPAASRSSFPVHPIQETGKRPTAALDRNLAYLSLVESLYGYFFDGVVLTTGCDKTTPAMIMGACTVNLPAIVLSGGPMLDGHFAGGLAGSGTIVWYARQELAAGRIDLKTVPRDGGVDSAPSVGHCNTMGTALSMNSMAEALGMSLPGCAAIPGPYRERGQMAYETGKRIVDMVWEDLKPSDILTRKAFENAIVAASALGASTNCPPHINAIARHIGVKLDNADWDKIGYDIPLLVNCMPAGKYLGEAFHRAGGVPTVMAELLRQEEDPRRRADRDRQDHGARTSRRAKPADGEVIKSYDKPMLGQAGFAVLSGNLFDSAIMKTSVISPEFRKKYLENARATRTPSKARRSCSRGRRTITTASTIRRCRSTRTASCSSATPARSAIPAPPRW